MVVSLDDKVKTSEVDVQACPTRHSSSETDFISIRSLPLSPNPRLLSAGSMVRAWALGTPDADWRMGPLGRDTGDQKR